jgi:hypothetical protein
LFLQKEIHLQTIKRIGDKLGWAVVFLLGAISLGIYIVLSSGTAGAEPVHAPQPSDCADLSFSAAGIQADGALRDTAIVECTYTGNGPAVFALLTEVPAQPTGAHSTAWERLDASTTITISDAKGTSVMYKDAPSALIRPGQRFTFAVKVEPGKILDHELVASWPDDNAELGVIAGGDDGSFRSFVPNK